VRCDAAALALEGQIGLVFYYRFSDAVLADTNAYVLFTYANGTEVKYLVSQMTIDKTSEDYVLYRAVCEMAAQDMFQTITAQVVYTIDGKNYTSYPIEYGVMTYYNNMYDNGSQKLKDLLDSLLAYGEKANNYFQNEEANEYPVESVTEGKLSDYAVTSDGTLPNGITEVSASLILESMTSIKVYIEGDVSSCVVMVDDKQVQPTLSGDGIYVVTIENISSSELDHIYTISISDGKNTKTFTYSALTYVRNELNSDDQNLVQLVYALYYYNQAANAYFE
jgi:3',5'-cyclic AMP phosphodiesterase CpdA